jgi:hypothetical protein
MIEEVRPRKLRLDGLGHWISSNCPQKILRCRQLKNGMLDAHRSKASKQLQPRVDAESLPVEAMPMARLHGQRRPQIGATIRRLQSRFKPGSRERI